MHSLTRTPVLSAVLTTTLLVALAKPAFAVLGETEAELVRRYGKPDNVLVGDKDLAPAEKVLAWSSPANYEVIVFMIAGASVRELYTLKQIVKGKDNPVIKQLLNENNNKQAWIAVGDEKLPEVNVFQEMKKEPTYKYFWYRKNGQSDDRAFVTENDDQEFCIESPIWRKAIWASQKK
jgi:hypothetical protein